MKTSLKHAAQAAGLAMMGLMVPISGHAFTINNTTVIGSEFTVNYLLKPGQSDGDGNNTVPINSNQNISAAVKFTLLSFDLNADLIGLQLNVLNNSNDINNNVGLNKLAFGTNPDSSFVTFEQITNGDVNRFYSASTSVSHELSLGNTLFLDIGTVTGPNNGSGADLKEGELDIFKLTLKFASIDNGVTFSPFSSKFRTGLGSFEFAGTEGGGNPGDVCLPNDTRPECNPSVPEPNQLALLGIGLFAMGAMRTIKGRKLA